MPYTERTTEVTAVLGGAFPDSYAIGTHDTAYINISNYHRVFVFLIVGEMQAGATLACSLRQATSTAGAGAKAITGKSITQLTQAGGDGNDYIGIELRSEELDVAGGFDCISLRIVIAGAAVEAAAGMLGTVPRYVPVGTTTWTEIVD